MKSHRLFSYSFITAGTVASAGAILGRWQWDETNVHTAIMLDWDDIQAVATRAFVKTAETGQRRVGVGELLRRFKENGATHLGLPELTLQRLLDRGELSPAQGSSADRVYLRAQNPAIAALVTTELQARLPHLQARSTKAKTPLISFNGDLPTVAEVGLGFDPAQAEAAHQAGLSPVARPIGYSWVQPEMIDRSLAQAAGLGAKIVAVQGNLIPGHEFKINHTVEAMRRHRLTYAYFRESRHQKGDWFLAKALAPEGLVVLAHEFEPPELLADDWFTISYHWANLAVETGVRLCSVRFFRILHAADPLEALEYVRELAGALAGAGLLPNGHVGSVDLTVYHTQNEPGLLAGAGLSVAGAAGLALDLLPLPDSLKLLALGAAAFVLTGLPFWEKAAVAPPQPHDHNHEHPHPHDHEHPHPHDHEHPHPHDHEHAHEHHEHSHSHDHISATAYAPKGLALAATIAYPAAAAAINGATLIGSLAHSLALSAAGTAALSAITAETDYLLGIEEYRGYNLDWLTPLGLVALSHLFQVQNLKSKIANPQWPWRWLAVAGVLLAALKNFNGGLSPDLPAAFDREHRQAHTHHLSAFQRALGDSKMALSAKPLRKWSLLAPLGVVGAALLKRNGQPELAGLALTAATAGQVATLTGFRNGQRPLLKTLEGRVRGWAVGAALAGIVWLGYSFFKVKHKS